VNPVLVFLLGLGALVVGAEVVVCEGSALAARFNVSPLVVGMTIVSLGTSLPELAIGLNAAQQGNAGLAVGNIVGTNLVNILLILGLSALIRPIAFEARTLRWDLPAMTGRRCCSSSWPPTATSTPSTVSGCASTAPRTWRS
jgi:cation:H+ antiporter